MSTGPDIAALFVDRRGPYWGREDIAAWDEVRDARLYTDDLPVVAHPPCQRWGRYWPGGPPAFAELLITLARGCR